MYLHKQVQFSGDSFEDYPNKLGTLTFAQPLLETVSHYGQYGDLHPALFRSAKWKVIRHRSCVGLYKGIVY